MPKLMRFVVKEVGSALAVLSVYLLTLLAPLHQAATSQSDFAELGYKTLATWSICEAINTADAEDDAKIVCLVASVAKTLLDSPPNPPIILCAANEPGLVSVKLSSRMGHPFGFNFQAAPRAPPAIV